MTHVLGGLSGWHKLDSDLMWRDPDGWPIEMFEKENAFWQNLGFGSKPVCFRWPKHCYVNWSAICCRCSRLSFSENCLLGNEFVKNCFHIIMDIMGVRIWQSWVSKARNSKMLSEFLFSVRQNISTKFFGGSLPREPNHVVRVGFCTVNCIQSEKNALWNPCTIAVWMTFWSNGFQFELQNHKSAQSSAGSDVFGWNQHLDVTSSFYIWKIRFVLHSVYLLFLTAKEAWWWTSGYFTKLMSTSLISKLMTSTYTLPRKWVKHTPSQHWDYKHKQFEARLFLGL